MGLNPTHKLAGIIKKLFQVNVLDSIIVMV